MIQPPEIFQRIYQQHGHRCPMSTLGGRLGMAALKTLGVGSSEHLTAVFEHDTCAIDGIELTTGCLRSNGSLQVKDSGRHALILQSVDGRSVRVHISEYALATAWTYRKVDEEFNSAKGTLLEAELKNLYKQKEAVLQAVLEKFWTLPDEDLLTVEML